MARLISDEDVKELIKGLDSLPWEEEVDDLVDAIPTVYDVDALVEQLKKAESVKLYGSNNSGNYLIPLKDAIDIVRKGGVNNV